MSSPENPQPARDRGDGAPAARETLARLGAEIRETRKQLVERLRAIRDPLAAAGVAPESFLADGTVLDGPAPEPLAAGSFEPGAGLFASPIEFIRSMRVQPDGFMCEVGPGNGDLSRAILKHCLPRTLHLFDARFDRLAPEVRDDRSVSLHEGVPSELLKSLPDRSLEFASVQNATSYAESGRILEALLPKLKPGGRLHLRNYTSWSILSGLPYGLPAAVHGLVNRGELRVVGLVPNALGYHQILLRKVGSSRTPLDRRAEPRPAAANPGPADLRPAASGAWGELAKTLRAFSTTETGPPAVLDWSGGRMPADALPEIPVFAPELGEGEILPYLDASVDVVAIPSGDAARMTEARRVATAAVVEIEAASPPDEPRITVHRLSAETDPVTRSPADPRGSGISRDLPLADRRILICSSFMPQPACDSYSRRLFHLVGFLRDAGCAVTCVAANPAGVEAFSGLLTGRGVQVLTGLDPKRVADLARAERFDWAMFGFWNNAASLLAAVRGAAPRTRLVVDSGDVHFLRNARRLLRDADGVPGRLDASFAVAAAQEIDVYAAADAVLAVSTKEADLVAELTGDASRTFAVPDSEDFDLSPVPLERRRGMFFVGNFGHPPNAEALEFLVRRVVPHLDPTLLAEHPIHVIGSGMTDSVRAITAGVPGVRTVGWVPSIRPWLEQVRVSLLPLLHGAGTKRKMIQALSIGTPSVSTSIGVEGFPLVDGRDVLVADDPVAFASGITRLVRDERLWRRLSAAGRETIVATHAHAIARERLLGALATILATPGRKTTAPSRRAASAEESATRSSECPFRGLGPAHVVTRPAGDAMRPAPRMSVVIPTRDRAEFLREALASLVAQTAAPDSFEVIVVNDGSTDATAEVCREFAGRLRLTRVDGPASGIGRAKNIGLELAAAPLTLLFDDDDVADPGLVAAHLDAHERYPLEHVAVLGFSDWHPRLEKTELMRFITDIGHYLFSYTHLRDGQLLDHTWFWGGRSSCKRSLILRAGGFRPEFTFGSEDIEAGYRISRLVARERRDAGMPSDEAGLAVVFRRDAVQRVIRTMTFDEFCRRCERQGRSQWQYHRFHDDPAVRTWCQIEGAGARWNEARDVLAERVARVHELERSLAGADEAGRGPLRDELHRLYRSCFDAFKAKGIVEEAARDAAGG